MIARLALVMLLGTVLLGPSPAFAAVKETVPAADRPAAASEAGARGFVGTAPAAPGTKITPIPAPTTEDTTAAMPRPATPANPVQIVPPSTGTPGVGSLLQTIMALGVVLGLLAVMAWGLKRWGPRQPTGASNLHIVGALNLGGRERIVVVEVGDQWIVVGASPGRINALATMPRQEGLAASAELQAHAAPAPNFAQWLKQTIEKRNAK
ncbi:flagellar biosynthetic protein FliO [Pseudoduganella sp. GCM10020061]|uniref:flagellar biosynthetic protein FliO n=1 Tax=Pseudoduganella sp. GCM10020061 TaxID=3317345 RepID=UPI0036412048